MMPRQNPGRSRQDYTTPRPFLEALERKFGKIFADLAARSDNAVAFHYISDETSDSLTLPWAEMFGPKLLFLNPPFGNIKAWASKCREESLKGAEILLLVPASVGSNWYWDHVAPYADVYSIGRLTFGGQEGKPQPFPKDLILCHYHGAPEPRFTRWQWKKS